MERRIKIVLKSNIPPKPEPTTIKSWISRFRVNYDDNHRLGQNWFWDNFQWDKQSLWIGKCHKRYDLPTDDSQVTDYLQTLIKDLNQDPTMTDQIYLKMYFSRNVRTQKPEVDYLIVCNSPQLPQTFVDSKINDLFEKYQLTRPIFDLNKDFREIVDHYLNWSNHYVCDQLIQEFKS